MKKRISALLLAAIMVLSLLPVTAAATGYTLNLGTDPADNGYWTLQGQMESITSLTDIPAGAVLYFYAAGSVESDISVCSSDFAETYHTLNFHAYPDAPAFKGWSADSMTAITDGMTLNALFDAPAAYTVTFDRNGGDTDADPQTIDQTCGEKYILPTTEPTRSGHTFAGWFTEADGGTEVTADTEVELTADASLYAHWTQTVIGGQKLPERASVVTGEGGEKKIQSGENEIEVKGADGENVPEEDLEAVAEALNNTMENEVVRKFGSETDETGLKRATGARDSEIASRLRNGTDDAVARSNITNGNIRKFLDVKLVTADVNVDKTDGTKVTVTAMTFDITPMATVTVAGTDGEVTLTTEITANETNGTVKFLLPVDETVGEAVKAAAVYYYKDDREVFLGNYPIKTDAGSGCRYTEVSTTALGRFRCVALGEATAEAKIGTTYFAKFTEAVTAVNNNQTITLLRNVSGTLTVSREVKFTVDPNGKTNSAVLIAGPGCKLTRVGNVYTFKKTSSSSGGGGGLGGLGIAGAVAYASYSVTPETFVKNGRISVSPTTALAGTKVTVTLTPDNGFSVRKLSVTLESGSEILTTSIGSNQYTFTMPNGNVRVDATFEADAGETEEKSFTDVDPTKYYYNPVTWALNNGITAGTDAKHFSPDEPVTRGQVVTFLWRAAGKPSTNYQMQMTDVPDGKYFTDAVRWALAMGITKGTSAATFDPDATCTRGQIVTFLARFAGVGDANTASVFTDVVATDFYAAAVKWAKNNGVTEGTTPSTFSPNEDCTRAQVVTFLWRWMVR